MTAKETKKHFNIFYSWQSDLNKKTNNHFIKGCIEKAIKELKKENEITVIPRLDKDTLGEAGSPRIIDTILKKIDAADIFIADVTIINSTWLNNFLKKRLTPNPNVLFELGYALHRMSWNRIICLNNNSFSNISDMPFDLQQNRISQYNYNGKKNKKEAKQDLTNLLKVAIKSVIDNYEKLLSEEQKANVYNHDRKIFEGFDRIIDDANFLEKLDFIARSQTVRGGYKLFGEMTDFLKAERNQFLIPELKEDATKLKIEIENMHTTLATTLQSESETIYDTSTGKTERVPYYHLPQNEQYFDSHKEYRENRDGRIERNLKAIESSKMAYKKFRGTVKKLLYI